MKKNWLKLLIVAMLAVILITALVACNGNKNPQQSNPADHSAYAGKYYEARGDKLLAGSWIELKSDGTWTDDDGESGQFSVSGNKITFSDGGFEFEGTLQNGTLSVDILGEVTVYKQGTPSVEPGPDETDKYTVTFVLDPNDEYEEEEIDPQEYEADEVMSELPIPERDGYNFLEWRGSDGKTYSRSSIMPADDLILTARWEEKVSVYEDDYVTFKPAAQGKKHDNNWYWDYNSYGIDKYIYVELTSEDLGGMSQVGEENNFRLTELEFSVKSGYQWTWYKDDFSTPNGTQRFTLEYGSNIQFVTAQDGAGNVQAIYLVDIYVLHDYKIELYKNVYEYGTSANPYDSFYVVEGNRIPDDIEKYTNYGYTPAGFVHYVENRNTDTMDEVSFGLDTVIKQDYKLYQTYEVAEIEAELEDGAFADGEKLQAKPFEEYQQLAVPTKEGFDFIGWKMSNGKYFADITGFTATNYLSTAVTKLTAEWRAKQLFEVWEGDEVTLCETVPYVTYTDATHNTILEVVYSPKGYDCSLPTVVDENSYFDHWEEYKYDSVKNEYNSAYIQFGGELTSPRAMHAKTMSDFTSEDTTRGIPLNSMRTFTNNSIDKYRVNLPSGLEESKDFVLRVEGNLVITREKFGSGTDTQSAQSYTVNGTKDIEIDTCGYTGLSFTVGNVSGSFKLGLYGPTAATTGTPAVGETIGVGDTLVADERLGCDFDGWFCENEKVSEEDSLEYTVTAEDEGKTFEKKYTVNPELANFVFDCDSTTLTITGVKDNTVKELVVPSYVTSIAKGAFIECSQLESITLPFVGDGNTNTYFGYIFGGNSYSDNASVVPSSLSEVVLTDLDSIAENAFRSSQTIVTITIPESVTSIGDGAFSDCTGLNTVNWNAINCTKAGSYSGYYDSHYIFKGCTQLATVNIGENVQTIPDYAFLWCEGIKKVNITSLEAWCEIEFGNSSANPLYEANYTQAGSAKLYVNNVEVTGEVEIPKGTTMIGDYAFYRLTGITSLTIPDSVQSIGSSAFSGCKGLQTITIGSGVTSIGSSAFSGCRITCITIPDSVQSIGSDAFVYCTDLQEVTIGSGVTSIGTYAFSDCTGITKVNVTSLKAWCEISFAVPAYPSSYSSNPLYEATNAKLFVKENGVEKEVTGDVEIPAGTTKIGVYAFCGLTGITSVTIPDSVKSIDYYAFSGCPITTLTMPANILAAIANSTSYISKNRLTTITITSGSIGVEAFSDYTGMQTVTIGEGVTSIGNKAFKGLTGLQTVNWDAINCTYAGNYDTSRYIDNTIFQGCTKLATVNIGENVQSIPNYTFYGCTGLQTVNWNATNCTTAGSYSSPIFGRTGLATVNIGENVQSIGSNAFSRCEITKVNYPGDLKGWFKIEFVNSSANPLYAATNAKLYVNNEEVTEVKELDGLTEIPDYAFHGLTDITSVIIPNSVISIGQGAFAYCRGITSITIPNSVQRIDYYAFQYCTGLQTVTIGEEVTSIGEEVTSIGSFAFSGCTGLQEVTIGASVTSIGSDAFEYCTGITKVNVTSLKAWCEISFAVPAYPSSYSSNPLYGAKGKAQLYINDEVITEVKALDGLTSIPAYAFYGCTDITSVTIPDSVTNIGSGAFSDCTSLTSITIPESVTSVGSSAFYNTAWYNDLSDGLVYIGKVLYKYKGDAPSHIEIRSDIVSIADYAFSNCTGLTSITIPESVTSIGHDAFYGCKYLSHVTFANPNGWSAKNIPFYREFKSYELSESAAYFLRNQYTDYNWYRKDN